MTTTSTRDTKSSAQLRREALAGIAGRRAARRASREVTPKSAVSASGAKKKRGQAGRDTHKRAAAPVGEAAIMHTTPSSGVPPTDNPIDGDQQASEAQSGGVADAGGYTRTDTHEHRASRENSDGGHEHSDFHYVDAAVDHEPDQARHDDHTPTVGLVVEQLREIHRERQDHHSAEKALTNRIKAICRRACDNDKAEGNKVYKSMLNGCDHELAAIVLDRSHKFLAARAILNEHRVSLEKQMVALAKQLPVAPFVEEIRGVGMLSLAQIIGEAGDLGNYGNPAKLWKRFGLAVMPDGTRQRKVTGLAAIEHGYSPSRRSIMWNVGDCIVRAGSGEYRDLYDARKVYERETAEAQGLTVKPAAKIKAADAGKCRSEGHIHNRAKRVMEKRLLRNLWRAWRAST